MTSRRERLRLLGLLRTGCGTATGLVAVRLVMELVPVGSALAAGWLVGALLRFDQRPAGTASELVAPVLLFGAVLVAGRVAESFEPAFATAVARRIDGTMRRRLRELALAPGQLTHLEDPAFQHLADRANDFGEGMGRTRSPGTAVAGQVTLMLRVAGALAATGLVAVALSPVLAAVLLAASLWIRARIRGQWLGLVAARDQDADADRRMDHWSELLTGSAGAKEVRLFGLSRWAVRRRYREAIRARARSWRELFAVLRRQRLVIAVAAGSAALALGVPGAAALRGAIEIDVLVVAVVAAWGIFGISLLGGEAFDIEYGLVGIRCFDQLVAQYGKEPAPAPVAAAGRAPSAEDLPAGGAPAVRFEHVSFAYSPTHPPVLDGLDLAVPAGQKLAIVGVNGAGKTTLTKLLAGLYYPTAGRITVDETALTSLDLRSWRKRLTVLFQDFLQYPGPMRTNVALSVPAALTDEVGYRTAAERAGAQDLLATLPGGADSPLWQGLTGGTDLSGGQWQRVAIARVLFAAAHGRQLVVLDEPTSHLDVGLEASFYDRVVGALPEATVLLISHRLGTVRPAERIVVLADGRVTEDGTHEQLMTLDGEYARLYRLQAGRFATGTAKVD